MLASVPANMLNQSRPDLGIPNRFKLKTSRFKSYDLTAGLQSINSLVATLRKLHPADSLADFPKVAFGAIAAF
jgi:hypothetical protein